MTTLLNIIVAIYFICCVINFFILKNNYKKHFNYSGGKVSLLILGGPFSLGYVLYLLLKL